MNILKIAAIDIGSNAIRLLIQDAVEFPSRTEFIKISLIRVPIRLGQDVFTRHYISEHSVERLISAMHGYRHMMDTFEVVTYRACATSAMREAKNGKEVVKKIFDKTGIKIEIIDGEQEAQIIYSTHIAELLNPDKSYLYIDVGGGSTEITLFSNNSFILSRSFPIGTVRLLNNMVNEKNWKEMKKWLRDIRSQYPELAIIGSGGNINKIFSLSRKKPGKPLSYDELNKMYLKFKKLSLEERIRYVRLNPHRADVIVPAAQIFNFAMKESGCSKIYVPQIGMADGIIHQLYIDYKRREMLSLE